MPKIAILGHGREGQATEEYFRARGAEITIFDHFTNDELAGFDLSSFDLVFRTPSVPLFAIPGVRQGPGGTYDTPANLTSITKYFFAHCPCPIIGVTGTKGKGTTCAMITAILKEYFKVSAPDRRVFFVGNVGTPAIGILDDLRSTDLVVYELSSFQLWDLDRSPEVAVVLRIEPDHLDRHADFADYLMAKSNLVRHQRPTDTCIYFSHNENSTQLAQLSPGHQVPYPDHHYDHLVSSLTIPGDHNKENASAAITAVFAACGDVPAAVISTALHDFQPLPHHLEFVRSLDGVDYYDDSFSASYPSLDVALSTFSSRPTIIIAGGFDRGLDLSATQSRLFFADNVKQVILLGQTARRLAAGQPAGKYQLATTLQQAVELARAAATPGSVVLLSPGAPSFDMFRDFYDRGDQFKAIVKGLH